MREAGRSVDINLRACITFDRIPLLGCCSFSTSPLLRPPIHHMSIINIVTMLPFCLSYPLSLSLSHTPFIFLTITSTFSLSLTLLSLHRSLFTFPVSFYAFLSLSFLQDSRSRFSHAAGPSIQRTGLLWKQFPF